MHLFRSRKPLIVGVFVFVASAAAAVVAIAGPTQPPSAPAAPVLLAPVHAIPMRVDTLFLGGYARGSFAEALQTVANELTTGERTMIGRHLDGMFGAALAGNDLTEGGRLRLAYERAVRPDGSTRAIRVLAAETAVDGKLHNAFFYERDGRPGYFDESGHSLDSRAWLRPLATLRVTSPFGLRRMHPILRRALPHTGVDYAAASGTPVRATGDGSVSSAGRRGGYGNMVEIQHPNGYTTRYAHLSRIASGVGRNSVVRQGEVIGYVGMTGLATGPHLHYEVRRRGQPVDPDRVAALGGPTGGIGYDAGWSAERRRLSRLLSRAPRVLGRG